MPIGITNDDDFNKELLKYSKKDTSKNVVPSSDSPSEVVDFSILDIPSRGRKSGDNNVPESLRSIIGETAILEGREEALDLASDFGISASSVSAYAKGATSTKTYNQPSQNIISHINKSRQKRINKASQIMKSAMNAITPEKLDYADVKDLSGIAKDMSVIIKNLEPKESATQTNNVSGPQFVIYAPQFKSESSFDVIEVKE